MSVRRVIEFMLYSRIGMNDFVGIYFFVCGYVVY